MFRKCIHFKDMGTITNMGDKLFYCEIKDLRGLSIDAQICFNCPDYATSYENDELDDNNELTSIDARKIINSLQFGVVPPEGILKITVGRDLQKEKSEADLNALENDSIVMFVEGDYGSGKSHMLDLVAELAFEKNFAVSQITIKNECPLHKLNLVYTELMENLKLPDKRDDPTFEWIIRKLGDGIYNEELQFQIPERLTLGLKNILDDAQNLQLFIDWLKGKKIPILEIRRRGTFPKMKLRIDEDDVFAFLNGISRILQFIDYSGLVLLFDEAENLLICTERQKIRALSNIIECFTKKDELSNVYFVFAITPDLGYRLERLIETKNVFTRITHLQLEEKIELAKKIREIHSIAYNWGPELVLTDDRIKKMCKKFGSGDRDYIEHPIRKLVKYITGLLEFVEQNPDFDIDSEIDLLEGEL